MKLEMFYDNTKKCWHLYINGDLKATCYLPITVIEWLNLSHYKYDLSELTRVLENSKMQSGKVHPINIEASYLPHEGIIEVNNTMDIHFDTMHENVPYVDIWQFYAEPAQDMFQHREDALKGDMNRMYQKCPYCGKKLTAHFD